MSGTEGDSCNVQQQCNGASHSGPDVKLTVVNADTKDDTEMVECQLETAKHTAVSFKFSRLTDQPNDVAASLVGETARLYYRSATIAFLARVALMLRCQCPSVCDGSALAHYG